MGRGALIVCHFEIVEDRADIPGVLPHFLGDTPYICEKRGETESHIKSALEKHGFKAQIGPEGAIPEGTDIIVRYGDKWKWDLAWYLTYLKISFIDLGHRDFHPISSRPCRAYTKKPSGHPTTRESSGFFLKLICA